MAKTTGGNRPLSPHLTVYRPQITSILSIFHRATGVAMAASMVLVVWWFLAAATGPEYFALVDGMLSSVLGALVLIASAFAFFYHFCNGIRHMWWDIGNGFEMEKVTASGIAVCAGSVIMTVLLLIIAI
ncbi:MAG: succinate dehydrogenase, cytochrome b556 subunit [Pseudomonadota bacterium]